MLAIPLEGVEFDDRWVIGFDDPCDHAFGAGGFLETDDGSALRVRVKPWHISLKARLHIT